MTINLSPLIALIFGAAAFIGICFIPAINWKELCKSSAPTTRRKLFFVAAWILVVHIVLFMAMLYPLNLRVRLW